MKEKRCVVETLFQAWAWELWESGACGLPCACVSAVQARAWLGTLEASKESALQWGIALSHVAFQPTRLSPQSWSNARLATAPPCSRAVERWGAGPRGLCMGVCRMGSRPRPCPSQRAKLVQQNPSLLWYLPATVGLWYWEESSRLLGSSSCKLCLAVLGRRPVSGTARVTSESCFPVRREVGQGSLSERCCGRRQAEASRKERILAAVFPSNGSNDRNV